MGLAVHVLVGLLGRIPGRIGGYGMNSGTSTFMTHGLLGACGHKGAAKGSDAQSSATPVLTTSDQPTAVAKTESEACQLQSLLLPSPQVHPEFASTAARLARA